MSRPRPDASARERVLRALSQAEGPRAPDITVASGDMLEPGFALDAVGRDWLAAGGDVQVVHAAAEVRFDLPLEAMRARNLGGAENALDLARSLGSRLARFDHVSTAYVAGDRRGVVLETERDVGQTARNPYEASKLEAEGAVAEAVTQGLPATVHRPSIIVGDARTGRASSFKVLYWPLGLYARGRFRTVFGDPLCRLDIVPVDFVVDAMQAAFREPATLGATLHLCAGPDRESSIGEVAELAREVYQGRPLRYVSPAVYRWARPWVRPVLRVLRPDVARKGGVYLPYLERNPSFDTRERETLLGIAGPRPPLVQEYFRTILAAAQAANFGR